MTEKLPARGKGAAGPRPYSREWFVALIGEDLVADAENRAAAAPTVTPAKVEEVRRIFARVNREMASEAHALAA